MDLLGHGSPENTESVPGEAGSINHLRKEWGDEELAGIEGALIPMALCQAAKAGDVDGLMIVVREYPGMVSAGDYDGRVSITRSRVILKKMNEKNG